MYAYAQSENEFSIIVSLIPNQCGISFLFEENVLDFFFYLFKQLFYVNYVPPRTMYMHLMEQNKWRKSIKNLK